MKFKHILKRQNKFHFQYLPKTPHHISWSMFLLYDCQYQKLCWEITTKSTFSLDRKGMDHPKNLNGLIYVITCILIWMIMPTIILYFIFFII